MSKSDITVSVDSEAYAEAAALFESLGLDFNSAVNMFLKQSVREQGLPFHPSLHPAPPMGGGMERPMRRPAPKFFKDEDPDFFDDEDEDDDFEDDDEDDEDDEDDDYIDFKALLNKMVQASEEKRKNNPDNR